VPVSNPDVVSKVAHFGMLVTENVSASPSVSEALGWNEYLVPATTVAVGVPVIEGGLTVAGAVSVAVAGGVGVEDVEVEDVEVEDVDEAVAGLTESLSPPPQPVAATASVAHRK
jgi:hypothetical protein